jgi:hypothetical protein
VGLGGSSSAFAGTIFLTGFDPDYHAYEGPNYEGAQDFLRVGVGFVTNPTLNTFAAEGINTFLFVQGNPPTPANPTDYIDGTLALQASGITNYAVAGCTSSGDCTALIAALGQLGTTYDALVIGSDFGGSLTQAELNVLDQHSAQIINFLNAGGGLFAMAESDSYVIGHETQGLTPGGGWFGFLPFVQSFGCGSEGQDEDILTSYGQGLGLQPSAVQGNWSHNCFSGSYGLNVVDVTGPDSPDPGAIQTLAGSGYVTDEGVEPTPEPCTLLLLATGLAAVAGASRKKKTHH